MKSSIEPMSWDDLRLAVAAVRTGSLSGAARRTGLSVATVGRRLDRLDRVLGMRLFHRHPGGVIASPEALALLARAEDIADQIDEIRRLAAAGARAVEGTVTLTTLEPLVSEVIAPRLVELRDAHPRLDVVIRTTARIERLDRRRADLAIRAVRPHEPRVIGRKLGTEHMALFASEDYLERRGRPATPDHDLRGHDVVSFDGGATGLPESAWLAERLHGEAPAYRVSTVASAAALVRSGAAIGLLPTLLVGAGLVELTATVPPREIWLVLHEDLRQAPPVRAVADFVARVVREALDRS